MVIVNVLLIYAVLLIGLSFFCPDSMSARHCREFGAWLTVIAYIVFLVPFVDTQIKPLLSWLATSLCLLVLVKYYRFSKEEKMGSLAPT